MQMQELTVKRREGMGKQLAKRLRRAGEVPAILYGGAKTETVTVDPQAVLRIIHGHEGTTQLLTLTFDGESGSAHGHHPRPCSSTRSPRTCSTSTSRKCRRTSRSR